MTEGTGRSGHIAAVDGLRAVAVVAVVLFHYFPESASGGFIGVDIFLVVSGYVIARSYLADLLAVERSLGEFFVRRVRRLAPAYAAMLAVTALVATTLLPPPQLSAFGRSLAAQPFYVQNVIFWLEGDYFYEPWQRPLLHTWSLAVEEQFYLLFGIAILALRRWSGGVERILAVAFFGSLISGFLVVRSSATAAFYLLPFRMWEIAAGVAAWTLASRMRGRSATRVEQVLIGAVLAGIGFSILGFDRMDGFPGPQALLATGATAAAAIAFDRRPSLWNRILGCPPLKYLGERSYSLYLWHWPLFALARAGTARELSLPELLALLIASLLVAELSYRFLESPIRRRRMVPADRRLLQGTLGAGVAIVAAGILFTTTRGLLQRYQGAARSLYAAAQDNHLNNRCSVAFRITRPGAEICPVNPSGSGKAVLLLGDSHADMLQEALGALAGRLGSSLYITVRTCDIDEYGAYPYCDASLLPKIVDEAGREGVGTVLLVSNWPPELDAEPFLQNAQLLISAGLDIVVVERVPVDPAFDPESIVRSLQAGQPIPRPVASGYWDGVSRTRRVFNRFIAENPGRVELISPGKMICDSVTCDPFAGGQPAYHDANHLSLAGAEHLAPIFASALGPER